MSLPLRERGLKFNVLNLHPSQAPSLPLRERGLKFRVSSTHDLGGTQSLPLRERGLKLDVRVEAPNYGQVAPLAGAWIEITLESTVATNTSSRSPCGSVD